MIFNLDHEMETLYFILNGEDPIPNPCIINVKIIRFFFFFPYKLLEISKGFYNRTI